MDTNIKSPIFVIIDGNEVRFLSEPWGFECILGMEPIDVADGLYTAYDSEGQILSLVTINDETGSIERPTETMYTINIPIFGKFSIGTVALDRSIKAIPQGVKDVEKLTEYLVEDLSRSGYEVAGLTLPALVAIYQAK